MSGKRRNSTIGPEWEDITCTMDNSVLLVVSRLSSYSSSILSSTSRSKDQSNYFRKLGTSSDPVTTRSGERACGKPMLTDHDKQATGNREPADETNEEDPMQIISVWLQPFTVDLEDLEAQVLAHSSERANSDSEGDASKVETRKRKHSVHAYFSKNQKRSILQKEEFGDLTTAEHKILNAGRESRNNHRYAAVVQALGTQWNPCQTKIHRRRRRIYESLQKPSQKPKVINTDNLLKYGKYCEELSWNHRTTTLHRSETSGIAEWAVRRIKEETSTVLLQSGSDDKWYSDSMECYGCLRDVQDLLADGKTPNERRFGESFWNMLCSTGEFGREIFWLLRLKNWKSWMHQKHIPEDWTRKKSW